jgi:hypothetical protein
MSSYHNVTPPKGPIRFEDATRRAGVEDEGDRALRAT